MNGQVGEELERRKRIDAVLAQYHQNSDTTAFYRNMEKLEADNSEIEYGVRRVVSRRYN